MKALFKRFLRNWVILLLPFVMFKMWIERKILKKYYVIAVTFHDVSQAEKYKFERIIRYLYQRFHFLTPQEFENYLDGQYQLKDICILMTFDDGFSSSKNVTSEILEPLGIKATFFCCSDFIGMSEPQARHFVAHNLYCGHRTEAEVNEAELAMSNAEALTLHKNGHLIAAHTQTHIDLGKEWPAETLKTEIIDSAVTMQNWVHQKIHWFAFPFGGISFINASSLQIIQKHFKFCFSGIRGSITRHSHPMALPRQSVTIQDPYPLQLALFYGATNWMHAKKIHKIESMAQGISC